MWSNIKIKLPRWSLQKLKQNRRSRVRYQSKSKIPGVIAFLWLLRHTLCVSKLFKLAIFLAKGTERLGLKPKPNLKLKNKSNKTVTFFSVSEPNKAKLLSFQSYCFGFCIAVCISNNQRILGKFKTGLQLYCTILFCELIQWCQTNFM